MKNAVDIIDQKLLDYDDLEPMELRFRHQKMNIVMREVSADAYRAYKNLNIQAAKLDSDGKVISMGDLADSDPVLMARCCWEVKADGTERQLKSGEVLAWPQKVFEARLEVLKKMSSIEQSEDDTEESLLKEQADVEKRLKKLREKSSSTEARLKENAEKNSP